MAKKKTVSPEDSPLIGQLKAAIRESGISLNELAKRSGVHNSQLSRFVRGEHDLSLSAAEKLMVYFDLKVMPGKPAQPAKP
ncbi:MAG TPA: helix-turn-helix transcriptional regulator [Gemmataceae bacterium]|nr:helix-turn-helix transcriptional regulator [Gemmataceae bacterium]